MSYVRKCNILIFWAPFLINEKHNDFFQDPPECSSYTPLNTADRASGFSDRKTVKCDRNDFPNIAKWYRFEGAAGTRMPTSPVPKQHCGTHATGWLNGKHPKKEEGVVSRKVCFNWSGNTCRWSIYVSVRNCGAFYVYHLGRTPGCSFRYCGNKGHGELSIHATDACILEQAWVQDGWILTTFAKIAPPKKPCQYPAILVNKGFVIWPTWEIPSG